MDLDFKFTAIKQDFYHTKAVNKEGVDKMRKKQCYYFASSF